MSKNKYYVFSRYFQIAEDPEASFTDEWEYMGSTIAVSEEKAINNVRFRTMGAISQHKPLAVSGHWATYREWKAEQI